MTPEALRAQPAAPHMRAILDKAAAEIERLTKELDHMVKVADKNLAMGMRLAREKEEMELLLRSQLQGR